MNQQERVEHGTLVWPLLAVAIWLSDRWTCAIPALTGVACGVWIANAQRARVRGRPGPWFALGSIMVVASLVYVYVLFLAFAFQSAPGIPVPVAGLAAGLVGLSVLLLGLIGVAVFQWRLPGWLSALWDQLLDTRRT